MVALVSKYLRDNIFSRNNLVAPLMRAVAKTLFTKNLDQYDFLLLFVNSEYRQNRQTS